MNFNRRTFIKSSSLIAGSIILQGSNAFPSFLSDKNGFRNIRNNFGVYNEKGGTIGWYINGDIVIVIDSQFPDSAKNFKNKLNENSDGMITYLFNTHHHRDHTMGNFYLKKFSENIIAHVNCPRLQIKQNKGKETEDQVVTANLTFDNHLKITLPKENLTAMYFGNAHTGGDILIHFENENIAHIGDLVFNNVYPFIDDNGEGSVKNWIEVLNKSLNYFDNNTKFIFGHADKNESVIGSKKDIIKMKNYLEALFDYTKKQIHEGKSMDEIANSNTIPGFDNLKELWKGARKMNLKSVAKEILI